MLTPSPGSGRPAVSRSPGSRARTATRVEHARQHRRDERGERDVVLAQRPRDPLGVEGRRLEHDRGRRRGGAHEHHQPADVRERHHAQPALVGI
jgi:hypothetical protein